MAVCGTTLTTPSQSIIVMYWLQMCLYYLSITVDLLAANIVTLCHVVRIHLHAGMPQAMGWRQLKEDRSSD